MKYIASILAAGFITLSACSSQQKQPAPTKNENQAKTANDVVQLTPEQAKNAALELGRPEKRTMHKTLKVSGVLEVPPQNMISVSIPLGGYLKKTTLLPGLHVHKGDLLATLEDQQYIQLQQDYLTAKAKLNYYKAEYERQQKLNESKAASDKVYQQALSDYESEKALLRATGEKLMLIGINPISLTDNNISRSINIYAPINGNVAKVNVNIGKYVSPTDVLFELVNPDDLHLTLTVMENDAANLHSEQKVVCYANNKSDVKYDAEIHVINPNIGKDRATEVHCHLLKYGKELLPGMFMNAEIDIQSATVNSLPEDAIVKWNNEPYVFYEIAANKFKMLKVETGTSSDGYMEVKTTLPDAKIVIKNSYTLLTKMMNSAEE